MLQYRSVLRATTKLVGKPSIRKSPVAKINVFSPVPTIVILEVLEVLEAGRELIRSQYFDLQEIPNPRTGTPKLSRSCRLKPAQFYHDIIIHPSISSLTGISEYHYSP
jgi:hypothetical protein